MTDKLKLLAAALLVIAGIAGFYVLGAAPLILRVLSVVAGLALAAGVLWFTAPGQAVFVLGRESIAEARKVVWPTRRETLQMTGVIIAFAVLMALFLWMVDGVLFWLVQRLMGRNVE